MSFARILRDFAAAAEVGDGASFAALFTEDGIYHDAFYGPFAGRAAIADMLSGLFHRDAEKLKWQMSDPVDNGETGYARWLFSYTSKMARNQGNRVVMEGIGYFKLRDGLIARYEDIARTGEAMVQLGLPPEKLHQVLGRHAADLAARPDAQPHVKG